MKGYYSIDDWLWSVPESQAGLPEEIEKAKDLLLGRMGVKRLQWLMEQLGSASKVLAAIKSAGPLNGSGRSPAKIGETASHYAITSDGIVAFFGDEPERWRLHGFWNGWSFQPDRIYVMRMFYTLDDVPVEKIRRVHLKLSDVVREACEQHAQPALLGALA